MNHFLTDIPTEVKLGSESVVAMKGQKTIITNPAENTPKVLAANAVDLNLRRASISINRCGVPTLPTTISLGRKKLTI